MNRATAPGPRGTLPTGITPRGALAGAASLHPACFALVMATGIVSIAAHLSAQEKIAVVLFALNIGFYAVLWLLSAWRAARFPRLMLADLLDHGRCVGFFTTVAGTCVLGSQFILIAASPRMAAALWGAGVVLWGLLTYAIFTSLTVKTTKPALAQGINGGWLLAVVATQSVSVLGVQLAGFFTPRQETVFFFALSLWLGGGMLYIWIISLIFYRYMFFTLEPSDLSPPYWINMGAMAISTLAGALLIMAAPESPLLQQVLPFLKGLTLFFWATATWWIPMLLILGMWRHVYRRFPLRYDPLYWGAVFPLGMYATCTLRLSQALNVFFIRAISSLFLWIAIAAWTAAFIGLAHHLVRRKPG
jgi:tellurite resistance protein TehA-like permease